MQTSISKIMEKIILAKEPVHIKLLGDSITQGVGGTGFEQNGEPIVEPFSRNPNGYCWANLFKDYMEKNYNCVVTNNACRGTRIEFVMYYFDQLVDETDDIIICMIGTNNRQQYFKDGPQCTRQEHMTKFYNNVVELYQMFQKAGKDVIFLASIPASKEREEGDNVNCWRHFHMNDVHDLYMKSSAACGFPFISLYSLFMEYCETKEIDFETLLDDGLHPNDKGYDVIFSLLLRALGLVKKID